MKMTKEQMQDYVFKHNKDPEDAVEYLNGLENKDGTYNIENIDTFLKR